MNLRSCISRADAAVPSLLTARSPTAVTRFVTQIIVDAVKTLAIWPFPYVRKKSSKTFTPSGTDVYSASTVMAIVSSMRIRAALNHVNPCMILRPAPYASCGPMCQPMSTVSFSPNTSAACRMTAIQTVPIHDRHIPTVAVTEPHRLTKAIASHLLKYPQPANPPPSNVNEWHARKYIH